jgi:hypothetical protein
MDLEQIVMVALILIIVYMLLHMSQTKATDSVVYLQTPYIGRGFGLGPWNGPRPGRHGRRHGPRHGPRHGHGRHGH